MTKLTFRAAGFLLTSLIACNLVDAKQLIRLHSGLECPESGYFRDVIDCKKFYYCPYASHEGPNLKPEEIPILQEIMTKGLDCPEGTLFDEKILSCQNLALIDSVPPECKQTELSHHHQQSHSQRKNEIIQEISSNH